MEGAELMEECIDRSYTQLFYKAIDRIVGEWRLDSNWWNQWKSEYLDRTGEAYNEGFLGSKQ